MVVAIRVPLQPELIRMPHPLHILVLKARGDAKVVKPLYMVMSGNGNALFMLPHVL